jgi:hypothetical protein
VARPALLAPRSRCAPARLAPAPPVQFKLDNADRALTSLDWAIIFKEEPGEPRMFTLVFNVSGCARARTNAGVSMWTPLMMFTAFPNTESIKANRTGPRGLPWRTPLQDQKTRCRGGPLPRRKRYTRRPGLL